MSNALRQGIANPLLRLAWRLSLGWLVGRKVLLLTTIGRDSGELHRVPLAFAYRSGTFYVMSDEGESADWYRNLLANPVCTLQAWPGPKAARARPIADPGELEEVFRRSHRGSLPDAAAEGKAWVALEPTGQRAPGMLEPDLIWTWPVGVAVLLVWRRLRT